MSGIGPTSNPHAMPAIRPMRWEAVDAEIGFEPGVHWDRDHENAGWVPLLYLAPFISSDVAIRMFSEDEDLKSDDRIIEWELRAHCPRHRAPDRWPHAINDLAELSYCRCMRWNGADWVPRFSEIDRKQAIDREAARCVYMADFTAPGIERALTEVPGVVVVGVDSPEPGRVTISIAYDPGHKLEIETIQKIANLVIDQIQPAHVQCDFYWRTHIPSIDWTDDGVSTIPYLSDPKNDSDTP